MRKLIIDNREYKSRLILGTGKYKDFNETRAAVKSSSCEIGRASCRERV